MSKETLFSKLSGTCAFTPIRGSCRFPENWPLVFCICPDHLNCVYGLKLDYTTIEDVIDDAVVGPYVFTSTGTVFPANTVVFPTRQFIDRTFVPESCTAEEQVDHQGYEMNPVIRTFHDKLLDQAKKSEAGVYNRRYQYEILRNIGMHPNETTLGHYTQKDTFVNFKSTIQRVLHGIESTIDNLVHYTNQFEKVAVHNGQNEPIQLGTMKISNVYKVLLSQCVSDRHSVPSRINNVAMLSVVPSNLQYVADIGFVATQKIARPRPLTLSADVTGTTAWHHAKVTRVPKIIKNVIITQKHVKNFNGLSHMLRGGSDNCLI